jgi:hypothetical protein
MTHSSAKAQIGPPHALYLFFCCPRQQTSDTILALTDQTASMTLSH